MATINDTQIITSNTTYNLMKASAKLMIETFENFLPLRIIDQQGLMNRHEDLTRKSGTALTVFNRPRLSSKGTTGDADRYSNAVPLESGARTLNIRLVGTSVNYDLTGTERQQIAEFDLSKDAPQMLSNWIRELMLVWFLNQAGGNTATSITIPTIADTAFSLAADLLRVTGNNTAIAPSTLYKGYGSNNAVSADESVTSSHPLKLVDFMNAREVINSSSLGVPLWNKLGKNMNGKLIDAVVFVGTTGMNQLKNDAVTVGQGINFAQMQYATLAGGKTFGEGAGLYYLENMLFVELPDYLLPRGVNSSTAAAVANTRRAVIVGKDAVDFGLGKGYSANGSDKALAGFSVEMDDEYKKLNKIGYAYASVNGGAKKVQIFGQGANAATAYDLSTYVITHYSRT